MSMSVKKAFRVVLPYGVLPKNLSPNHLYAVAPYPFSTKLSMNFVV